MPDWPTLIDRGAQQGYSLREKEHFRVFHSLHEAFRASAHLALTA